MDLGVFGAGDDSDVSDAADQSATRDLAAAPTSSLDERRELAEHLDDPLNRYYRYPAARGLLRIAGGLPLRPDHITYLHTTIGVAGAAILGAHTTRTTLVVAFVFARDLG